MPTSQQLLKNFLEWYQTRDLTLRPDVNTYGDDGLTPLMVAAQQGDLESIKKLIDWGADVFALSDHSSRMFNNILHFAAEGGHVEIVKFFIEYFQQAEKPITVGNADGVTLLHTAAARGDVTIVQLLIPHFTPVTPASQFLDRFGGSPLHAVCSQPFQPYEAERRVAIVELLIQAGFNPVLRNQEENDALCFAAKSGALSILKYLLEVHPMDDRYNYHMALRCAARGDHFECVKYMIERLPAQAVQAVVNLQLFYDAISGGDYHLLEYLLSFKNDEAQPLLNIGNFSFQFKQTLLVNAVEKGELGLFVFLLDHFIDVVAPITVLLLKKVACLGHLSILRHLTLKLENKDRCVDLLQEVLCEAINAGQANIVEYLLTLKKDGVEDPLFDRSWWRRNERLLPNLKSGQYSSKMREKILQCIARLVHDSDKMAVRQSSYCQRAFFNAISLGNLALVQAFVTAGVFYKEDDWGFSDVDGVESAISQVMANASTLFQVVALEFAVNCDHSPIVTYLLTCVSDLSSEKKKRLLTHVLYSGSYDLVEILFGEQDVGVIKEFLNEFFAQGGDIDADDFTDKLIADLLLKASIDFSQEWISDNFQLSIRVGMPESAKVLYKKMMETMAKEDILRVIEDNNLLSKAIGSADEGLVAWLIVLGANSANYAEAIQQLVFNLTPKGQAKFLETLSCSPNTAIVEQNAGKLPRGYLTYPADIRFLFGSLSPCSLFRVSASIRSSSSFDDAANGCWPMDQLNFNKLAAMVAMLNFICCDRRKPADGVAQRCRLPAELYLLVLSAMLQSEPGCPSQFQLSA